MDVERELQRLSDQVRGLCDLVGSLTGGARTAPASQLTLAGVVEDLTERTAVQMGDPDELELVDARLHGLVPPSGGVGAIIAGMVREGATTRWHKTAAWRNFDELPAGRLLHFLAPLGHPHRIDLLKRLALGVATTGQLQRDTEMTGGQFYHHLSRLAEAGYLSRLAEGRYVLSTRGKVALACLAALCSLLAEWPDDIGERQAREKLLSDRPDRPPDSPEEPTVEPPQ